MRHKRLLFVLRCRENYWGPSPYGHHSSGLANSVRFIVDMLNNHGITAARPSILSSYFYFR